ncbi:MAG: YqgE/AlgH family protein [Methylococcus sp.]|nr:YqgE/AlgH family protein [Methylococcus sp.]
MSPQSEFLANHFLIAMPGLADPHFSKTVTLLCQHDGQGALGIIVNRPSELRLRDVMKQMEIELAIPEMGDLPVFFGGPVHPERGFILHEPAQLWASTLVVSDKLALTTSRDILEAVGRGEGPSRMLLALGYAGWGQGQLEREIVENAWLNAPADNAIIFERPPLQRWKAAADLMGIDISLLTSQAGHG